jgi:hypothetical protein
MFTELDIFRLSTMVPGILSGSKISGAIRFERGAGLKSEVVAIAGIQAGFLKSQITLDTKENQFNQRR